MNDRCFWNYNIPFYFSPLDTLKVDIKASKLTLGTNDEESKSMYDF